MEITLPAKFEEFATGDYRYRVAYGGRGSGKSWSIATLLVLRALQAPTRILCAREIQKSINDSVKQLLADTIERMGMSFLFDIQTTTIYGKNGSRFLFEGLRSNITKIKSLEGIDICWVEEAETITASSLDVLIPTIRKPGSEIWISFNPSYDTDPVYERWVIGPPPPLSHAVKIDYMDNPWLPKELADEAQYLRSTNAGLYRHIWEGELVSLDESAYYARLIDPDKCLRFEVERALPVHTAWDLGMSDSTAIIFFQHSPGGEVRIVHSYEQHSEGLQHYVTYIHAWRDKHLAVMGKHIAPHDIKVRELGSGKSRYEVAQSMGIRFDVAPQLGLEDGIQSARTLIPRCYFNMDPSSGAVDLLRALKKYRKEWDEVHQVYKKKPLHDSSSHYADAFRYMAIGFKPDVVVNSEHLIPDWSPDI